MNPDLYKTGNTCTRPITPGSTAFATVRMLTFACTYPGYAFREQALLLQDKNSGKETY